MSPEHLHVKMLGVAVRRRDAERNDGQVIADTKDLVERRYYDKNRNIEGLTPSLCSHCDLLSNDQEGERNEKNQSFDPVRDSCRFCTDHTE